MKASVFTYVIFVLFTQYCYSQLPVENWSIIAKYQFGVVMPLHESVNYLVETNSCVSAISFKKKLTDSREFVAAYNFPSVGFGMNSNTLGNNEVFGRATSFYSFYTFPLISQLSFELNLQIAAGLAYINKTFDIATNNLNNVIGSHLNAYISFSSDARIELYKKVDLLAGIYYHHYSNGKIKLPNLGLNTFNYSIGFAYNFNEKSIDKNNSNTKYSGSDMELNILLSAGFNAIDVSVDKKYLSSTFATDFYYRLNHKYKLGIGANLFYYSAFKQINSIADEIPNESIQKVNSGIHHSQALVIGNTTMYLQVGYYLFKDELLETSLYDRLGIQYQLKNNILLNVSIKAQYFKADYIEWGIGYVWKK